MFAGIFAHLSSYDAHWFMDESSKKFNCDQRVQWIYLWHLICPPQFKQKPIELITTGSYTRQTIAWHMYLTHGYSGFNVACLVANTFRPWCNNLRYAMWIATIWHGQTNDSKYTMDKLKQNVSTYYSSTYFNLHGGNAIIFIRLLFYILDWCGNGEGLLLLMWCFWAVVASWIGCQKLICWPVDCITSAQCFLPNLHSAFSPMVTTPILSFRDKWWKSLT